MLCLEYIVWYGQFVTNWCDFIKMPHKFRRDAWRNLWSSASYRSLHQALPSMYRRRWHHIHAFFWKNTIALRVQRFAAGANIICLTYAEDWWSVISPVIHGESKSHSEQLGPWGSTSHFVNNRRSRVKTWGASCIGGFGQTDGRRKFELGIPQSRGASYIRGVSYIRDKTVPLKISDATLTGILWKRCDRQRDRRTEIRTVHRAAWFQLKNLLNLLDMVLISDE